MFSTLVDQWDSLELMEMLVSCICVQTIVHYFYGMRDCTGSEEDTSTTLVVPWFQSSSSDEGNDECDVEKIENERFIITVNNQNAEQYYETHHCKIRNIHDSSEELSIRKMHLKPDIVSKMKKMLSKSKLLTK